MRTPDEIRALAWDVASKSIDNALASEWYFAQGEDGFGKGESFGFHAKKATAYVEMLSWMLKEDWWLDPYIYDTAIRS